MDALEDRLLQLQVGDTLAPRVVVLRGGSGVDREQIIRQFYARLASSRVVPSFWPSQNALYEDGHFAASCEDPTIEAYAETVLSDSRPDRPAVAIVRDTDRMDSAEIEALDVLAKPSEGHPVLSVLVNKSERGSAPAWDAWVRGAEEQGLAEVWDVRALEIDALELDDEYTVGAMLDLARSFYALEQYEKAIPFLERVYRHLVAVLGTDHAVTLKTRLELANALSRASRHEEAEEHCQAILDYHTRTFGPDHETTRDAECLLGAALANARKYEEAVPYLRRCVVHLSEAIGPAHEDTEFIQTLLAATLLKLGRREEALPYIEELQARTGADKAAGHHHHR